MESTSGKLKKVYPLTSYQKDIWLQHCLYPGETLHTIGGYLMMEGELCVQSLMKAIRDITMEHKAIKTRIGVKDHIPFQRFLADEDIFIEYIDLSGEDDPEASCKEAMDRAYQVPFELYGKPLYEYKIFKIREQLYCSFVKFHHIIMDGWGVSIFFRLMADNYHRIMEKKENFYGEGDYSEFIEDHFRYLESDRYKLDEKFWKNQLTLLPENNLFGQNRGESKTDKIREADVVMIPRKFYDDMTEYAYRAGSSTFHFIIGILFVYFDRLFPSDQSVIGVPILNRKEKYKDTIGLFVNLIPVILEINRTGTFAELLQMIRKSLLLSYRHVEYPYGDMLALASEGKESGRLFDLSLSYEKYDYDGSYPDLKVTSVPMDHKRHKNPLTVFVREYSKKKDVRIEFCYGQDWFDEHFDTGLMIKNMTFLIQQILAGGSKQIAELEIQEPEEKRDLIIRLNRTVLPFPDYKNIPVIFEEQAKKTPDLIAVADEERSLTYRELDEASDILAAVLMDRGVRKDTVIGLFMDRKVDLVTGIIGILKSGGAYLPLDPEAPVNRINYMIEESQAPFIVTKESLVTGDRFKSTVVYLDRIMQYEPQNERLAEAWKHQDCEGVKMFIHEDNVIRSHDLAYVIYTSGTSGKPKGAMIEHRNVINLVFALQERLYRDFSCPLHFALISPYFFDASVCQIFPALLLGHSIYIIGEETRLSGERLIRFYDTYQIDIADGTPTHMHILLHELEKSDRLLNVKLFGLGGESLSYPLVKELKKHCRQGLDVVNLYGPTECCVLTTIHNVKEEGEGQAPIGTPIANTSAYILNAHLQPQPVGVVGELYLGGACVGRGYLNNRELTEERFLPNPFVKNQKMYKTGDLARWNKNGQIEFFGRADGQVKIRGHRIELDEISNQLMKIHWIEKAAAVVREDGKDPYICAYLAGGPSIDREALIHELSKELPNYMIPSYFVSVDTFPMTHNGKLDLKALPAPIPEESREEEDASYSDVEKGVQKIFLELLSLQHVSKKENFFYLGGHSIKAMYLSSEIEKAFHVNIPIKQIFDHPTVEALGKLIEQSSKEFTIPIPAAEKKEFYPLSYPQKQMFIISQIKDCGITYNIPGVYLVEGELDKDRFLTALKKLTARHEALRTSFLQKELMPVQEVADCVSVSLELLSGEGKDIKQVIREFIRPFDLSKAPLMRVGLLEKDRFHSILLFDFHHIISDGISAEIFMKELIALYQGRPLPELTVQYRDFVEWEEKKEQQSERNWHKEYWKEQYSPDIPILELPTDGQRPASQTYVGDRIFFELDSECAGKLRKLTEETGASLFMILFAQYYVLLSKYSRQSDIIVGTPMAGRKHPDVQNVMGMFVNTIGIRNFPKQDKTFLTFLEEVKETVMQGYEHQDYRLEEILSELNVKRDMSRSPLFDTVFTMNTAAGQELKTDGITLKPTYFDFPVSKYDLTVTGKEYESVLHFEIEFSTALFQRDTMLRFAKHFRQIVQATLEAPEKKLGEIELMSSKERQQMLETVVSGPRTEKMDKTVLTLFEEQVKRAPDRIALVHQQKNMTYRELDEMAGLMSERLQMRKQKAPKNCNIAALLYPNSMELVVGMLACLKAGISFLPIDPDSPADRLNYMLKDSQAFAVMTKRELYSEFKECFREFPEECFLFSEDGKRVDLREALYREEQNKRGGPFREEENGNAYIIYTSGSTGKPKGVLVGQEAFTNFCLWFKSYYQITEEDRTTKYAGVAFDASLSEVFPYLICGASIHIIDRELKYNVEQLNCYYEEQKISISFLPTQTCEQFMKIDNRSLRILLTGGEKLKQYHKRNYMVINNYGPTEATIMASAHIVQKPEYQIPIGRPIDNTDIYILEGQDTLMPIGVPGELCIAGRSLANGYLNHPMLTKEKFVSNPFKPGEKMYRTGDLARYRENGVLEYLGRMDRQVKIRGYRIELGEIEHRIKEIPGIENAVVAVKEIRNTEILAAYLVTRDDKVLKGIKDELGRMLPGYMIPTCYISLAEIPLTPNGKVDVIALPQPDIEEASSYQPPRNGKEKMLAEIWEKVLNIEKIGIQDNFFEIGGDSISMMNVLSQLNRAGFYVSAKNFMEHPSIANISKLAVDACRESTDGLKEYGRVPLLPNRSMLDRRNKRENVNHWNLGLLLEVSPVPAAEDVDRVIQYLYRHHDGLRLRLRKGEDGWVQEILPPDVPLNVAQIDLSHIQQEHQKDEIEKLTAEYQQQITLDTEPMKAAFIYLGKQCPGRIIMVMHHALIDGYSAVLILEDFTQLYRQMMNRQELRLPHKTTSLKQWSEYLKDYAQTKEVCEDAEYWLELPDMIEDIPYDHREELENNFFQYERFYREILCSGEGMEKLRSALVKNRLQLNSVILAAMAKAIEDWAGHSNFLIDYTLNGRYPVSEQMDLSRTVGWLAYLVPLYLGVQGGDVFSNAHKVNAKLERLPKGGLSYGCLRDLSENRELKERMEQIHNPVITYNYFRNEKGETDVSKDDFILRFAKESAGQNEGDWISRGRLLDFVVGEENGELILRIHYSCNIHNEETIKRLWQDVKQNFLRILEQLD